MDSFPDSSADVLNDLDPLSRALLDLSIQRGMDDAEIAQVLGTDEDSVFEVRVGLLRNLAEKVAPEHAESELPELQTAVAERLYPEDDTAVEADDLGDEVDEAELEETPVEATPEAEDAALEPGVTEPEAADAEPEAAAASPTPTSRRRSLLPIILPILLLLTVVAVIIVAGSGDDPASKPPAQRQSTQASTPETTQKAEEPKPTKLTALGSGGATGTAAIADDRLTMTLRNLPDANGVTYTVWLYNSVIDAKQIGIVKNGKVDVKLPKGADKYEFVDVSVEPKDDNANHSGQSVARVPLKKLGS